jgi:hypothetical protein
LRLLKTTEVHFLRRFPSFLGCLCRLSELFFFFVNRHTSGSPIFLPDGRWPPSPAPRSFTGLKTFSKDLRPLMLLGYKIFEAETQKNNHVWPSINESGEVLIKNSPALTRPKPPERMPTALSLTSLKKGLLTPTIFYYNNGKIKNHCLR